jgi:recombination protein RecT
MQCSQMGLEPDGRRAHLIPFENKKKGTMECTLIVDWKGLAELAMRGGTIAKLHADLICDHDDFSFDMGEILHHKIEFRKERGAPFAAYAMATTKTGEKFVQVMTRSEIEAIRDNSQGWRAFKAGYTFSSPWQDSTGEMWKKTVFRRLSKWLVLSPEFRDAQEIDEATDVDLTVNAQRPLSELPKFDPAPEIEDGKTVDVASTTTATPPEPEKPADKPKSINYVKGMRGLLKLANISEADFMSFMRETGKLDESIGTIDEVSMVAPIRLQHSYDNWNTIKDQMAAVPKVGAQ